MKKHVRVLLVDAFTATPGTGNRAGVILNASGLSAGEMQAVAAQVNVSECAFVIPEPGNGFDLEVRYFTPAVEVPLCGHATIAAHWARAGELGLTSGRVVARTGAGDLPVDVVIADGVRKVVMTQGAIEFTPPYDQPTRDAILAALGLTPADLVAGLPVQAVSAGHSKVMVPITSTAALDRLRPDMAALAALSEDIGCNGFFVFAFTPKGDACLTSGRMFAPAIGIDEDPVTGNANGPCGAYLSRHGRLPARERVSYDGRQGVAMGKPGVVEVTVRRDGSGPVLTQVGGTAVSAGELDLVVCDGSGAVRVHPAG
jgi:PhzF family phenazine biosynthesis protein